MERFGNCTDFHALFISFARSEGMPIPNSRRMGKIDGDHCWAEFYLPETGWIPIDASEAFKHSDKKDFFFGTHSGEPPST
ncbi:MAG TPA: transglutaminase domain-containing protein [Myxococcales bacterium]|nr:transglutaminase domain-containing protein [Myxococcales bacterium]HIK83689.1 transglutaminase domain-containing protein [Myxococcales bacterium]